MEQLDLLRVYLERTLTLNISRKIGHQWVAGNPRCDRTASQYIGPAVDKNRSVNIDAETKRYFQILPLVADCGFGVPGGMESGLLGVVSKWK